MIEEIKFWNRRAENDPGFDPDVYESFYEFARIFTKPLVTDDLKKNTSFTSWRGRLVSLCTMGKKIFTETLGLVRNGIAVVYMTAITALEALNFAFSKTSREEFFILLGGLIGTSCGLALRPLAFASNMLMLAGGALIHPSIAIGAKRID